MSTQPSARRTRPPAIASASSAIVSSGPEGLLILPWRGKRASGVRRRLNRRRVRVYHTTWTPQTAPTEPTGIVVLVLIQEITRTTSMIPCDTEGVAAFQFSNLRRFFGGQFWMSPGGQFRMSLDTSVTFSRPRGRRVASACGCDGLDPVQGHLPAAACFGSVEGAGDALDHDRRDGVTGAVCGDGQVSVLVVGLVVDIEASVGEGSDPVLGETPPRVPAPLDGAVMVERLVPHLDDQKREPGVRLAVVPSSGCALTGRWPSTTIRSPSPTLPSSPTRGGGRRIPRRGTRLQLDSDGVLASLGRPCAQVSVEQIELGVRLERGGFDARSNSARLRR